MCPYRECCCRYVESFQRVPLQTLMLGAMSYFDLFDDVAFKSHLISGLIEGILYFFIKINSIMNDTLVDLTSLFGKLTQ